ncbi:DUF6988 family protein [Paracidovorax avenae]|uniref:DUF6988 family protein n=1 Tax=Paracidovorax avenae TaxID=80867 RepID=UPI001AD8127B|nr:hypothetical protein [Paracidovorax avenae]
MKARDAILAGTSYAVCLDHREAILLLVWRDFRSSALALWRSVYEALMRGYWAETCASDQAFEQLEATRELPSFDTMIKALDKQDAKSAYGKTKAKLWKPMSHFAHGGVMQLANWLGPEGVGARHSDLHVAQLLASVDIYALLACAGANRLAHIDPIDESEFDAKLDELLAALAALTGCSAGF